MGVINETVVSVLAVKYPHKKNPACSTLEAYNKMPIFIPMGITEDVVKSVVRKLSGISGPGGMDSEALQGWLLKSGEDNKKILTSVEIFVN